MGAVWGRNLSLTLFGESHGNGIGGVLSGIPAGLPFDPEYVQSEMDRRKPGHQIGTKRREGDQPEWLSGIHQGKTTGAPIAFVIRNTDTRSADYSEMMAFDRPGHADYPASIKYGGHNDVRGGGPFSARMTAVVTCAGALCKHWLEFAGIRIAGRIASIGHLSDQEIDMMSPPMDELVASRKEILCVLDADIRKRMAELVEQNRMDLDSVGGTIDVFATGVPAGLGDPYFNSFESQFASLAYAIPAVKSVSFGHGEGASRMRGSEHNDSYIGDEELVRTVSNHAGGILGGLTTGMPIVSRLAFKPTASISKPQYTLNKQMWEQQWLQIKGRHDPCVAVRAVPIVEAAMALTIMDFMILRYGEDLVKSVLMPGK